MHARTLHHIWRSHFGPCIATPLPQSPIAWIGGSMRLAAVACRHAISYHASHLSAPPPPAPPSTAATQLIDWRQHVLRRCCMHARYIVCGEHPTSGHFIPLLHSTSARIGGKLRSCNNKHIFLHEHSLASVRDKRLAAVACASHVLSGNSFTSCKWSQWPSSMLHAQSVLTNTRTLCCTSTRTRRPSTAYPHKKWPRGQAVVCILHPPHRFVCTARAHASEASAAQLYQ